MCCDSMMSRCVAVGLMVLYSLVLAACGGGSSSGGNTTSYTVTANAGAGGGISPASATVNSGATASFTVTPNGGNSINTVTGCGGALAGSTYTTGAVTANCTVAASFVSNGLPTISIADASVSEGNSGTTSLNFTVTLSALANGNVNVNFVTSDNSPAAGSATSGSDYTAGNGTLTIPAASASATISVGVLGDANVEGNETLTVTLSNPSGNATLGTAVATGTILGDDTTGTLNDTGIIYCTDEAGGFTCPQATHPGQDGEYGRDVTANDNSDGDAGFSYTKLDNSGSALSASAASWDCVKDNVTGLIWEAKTTDGGLRDKSWNYTWYNSTGMNDGGEHGVGDTGAGTSTDLETYAALAIGSDNCLSNTRCDTEKYTADVNATNLCGGNDWRLPSKHELLSIVHFGTSRNNFPYIDRAYFPNTWLLNYWTSSSYGMPTPVPGGTQPVNAWYVRFGLNNVGPSVNYSSKIGSFYVRLVRDSN